MIWRTSTRAAALAAALLAAPAAHAADLSLSGLGGYQGGVGLRLGGTVRDAIPGLPLAFSAGVGYAFRDPGDALQARAVFINQNTNGTPEKSGRVWDLRLDVVWLLRIAGLQEAGAFVGVRHSWFMGDFRYVGGNEDFEIVSNEWGWGAGVRGAVAMSPAWSLNFQAGFDHYPAWSLTGHDATYASSGAMVNARDNGTGTGATYLPRDADRAVNQPKLVPSILVGLTWTPGADAAPRRR
jgi:hypothetical protein